MKFYKDHYDVIVIGGALAGLSSALMLAEKGKDVLVLERHNLPGGIATSFVRGGIEIEAALHEMMSIGPEGNRLKVGKFLEDMGVEIDWLKVPEAYHASLPGLEVTLHPGLETFAKEVDAAVPGTYEKVLKLLNLCHTVFDSVNELCARRHRDRSRAARDDGHRSRGQAPEDRRISGKHGRQRRLAQGAGGVPRFPARHRSDAASGV